MGKPKVAKKGPPAAPPTAAAGASGTPSTNTSASASASSSPGQHHNSRPEVEPGANGDSTMPRGQQHKPIIEPGAVAADRGTDESPGYVARPCPAMVRVVLSPAEADAAERWATGTAGAPASAAQLPNLTRPEEAALAADLLALYHLPLDQHEQLACVVERRFDAGTVWDTPLVQAHGASSMQALLLAARGAFEFRFRPEEVEVGPHGHGGSGLLKLRGTMTLVPRHNLLGAALALALDELPLAMTLEGAYWLHSGKIYRLTERLHNLPAVPYAVRAAFGLVAGSLAGHTQALWVKPYARMLGATAKSDGLPMKAIPPAAPVMSPVA